MTTVTAIADTAQIGITPSGVEMPTAVPQATAHEKRPRAGAPSSLQVHETMESLAKKLGKGLDYILKGEEGDVRKYLNEHHFYLEAELAEAVEHYARTAVISELGKVPYRAHVNGMAGKFVARTQIFAFDLPGLGDTAFVVPNGRIFFNAMFLERLLNESRNESYPLNAFEFVLEHEAQHGLRQHFTRLSNENPQLVNYAGDMVINLSIQIEHALQNIRRRNPDFDLKPQDGNWNLIRDTSEWKVLREEVQSIQQNLPPSISLGVGFRIEDFDEYALRSTEDVLARLRNSFESRDMQDDPNRKIDIRDVMEGVARDLERLAQHPAITQRPVDASNPYDLTKLAPVLAEDVRDLGDLFAGRNAGANKHRPSPSQQAGVSCTYPNRPLSKTQAVEIMGRLQNYSGSEEYTAILDVDHKTAHASGLPALVQTGDKWVDAMTPSERLSTALDLLRQALFPQSSQTNSTESSNAPSVCIDNPFGSPPPDGRQPQNQNSQGGQASSQNDSGNDPSQSQDSHNSKGSRNSQSNEADRDADTGLSGCLPEITVKDTQAAGADSGMRVADNNHEHLLDQGTLNDSLKGNYDHILKEMGAHNKDPRTGKNRSPQEMQNSADVQGRALAEEVMQEMERENASYGGGRATPGDHMPGGAYSQISRFRKPVLSFQLVMDQLTEALHRTRQGPMHEGELPAAYTFAPEVAGMLDSFGGIILEQMRVGQEPPLLGVLVDTSGSVSDSLLIRFMSEVRGMLQDSHEQQFKLAVSTADTVGRTLDVLDDKDVSEFLAQAMVVGGRGGTDFEGSARSLIQAFQEGQPLEGQRLFSLLYFTDGGDTPIHRGALQVMCEQAGIPVPPVTYIIPDVCRDDHFTKLAEAQGATVVHFNPEELGRQHSQQVVSLSDAVAHRQESSRPSSSSSKPRRKC